MLSASKPRKSPYIYGVSHQSLSHEISTLSTAGRISQPFAHKFSARQQ